LKKINKGMKEDGLRMKTSNLLFLFTTIKTFSPLGTRGSKIFYNSRVCKIFRTFSEYLNERTAAQCRSHYQKIIIKHKTLAKLKKHYKQIYGDNQYNQEFDNFRKQWEDTHPPSAKTTN
jgi:hypothetical protein